MAIAAVRDVRAPLRGAMRSPLLVLGVLLVTLIVAAGIAASVGAAGIPL